MREQLEKRLNELKAEFEKGQKTLTELEAQQANLRETLLRISGAIQVLEEELQKDQEQSGEIADTVTDKAERPVQVANE
jgi:predicted nuclease with TOPRIM domain